MTKIMGAFCCFGNQRQWAYNNLHHQAVGWEFELDNQKRCLALPKNVIFHNTREQSGSQTVKGSVCKPQIFQFFPEDFYVYPLPFLKTFLSKAAWLAKGSSDSQQAPEVWIENPSIISTPRKYSCAFDIFTLYEIRYRNSSKRGREESPPPKKKKLKCFLSLF